MLRIRDFELDVGAYQLRRNGRPVRIERQPMDLLLLLVERHGQLVSRSEIVDRLWGKDVFVDVETGVHTAIRKVRQALRDPRDAPVFVETVPGKGYRFIAAVEVVAAPHESARRESEIAVATPKHPGDSAAAKSAAAALAGALTAVPAALTPRATRAYDARDVHLIFLAVDPKWDSYRADPRFEALLVRCGFRRTSPASPH